MSERREERRPVEGVFEDAEGVRDFFTFESYLEGWVKPHVLPDLETVFEGASERWRRVVPSGRGPGRGDFVMAAALFSVFDHLGGFLAADGEWIGTEENIARVAKRLATTADVYAILANMGRHGLVHGVWPQTDIKMRGQRPDTGGWESWHFGLSFNASPDPTRHDTLHAKPWRSPGGRAPEEPQRATKVLKLVLNVQSLRRGLAYGVEAGTLFKDAPPGAFRRVRDASIFAGDPRPKRQAEMNRHLNPRKPGEYAARSCGWAVMEEQIEALFHEAIRVGAWTGSADRRYPRDHGGRRPPVSAATGITVSGFATGAGLG